VLTKQRPPREHQVSRRPRQTEKGSQLSASLLAALVGHTASTAFQRGLAVSAREHAAASVG